MGWFSAMIVFESEVEGTRDTYPVREESIRIFRADADAMAWKMAEDIGRRNEHSYKNEKGELVTWRFVQVAEVQDLCEEELTDGLEVFSRMKPKGV